MIRNNHIGEPVGRRTARPPGSDGLTTHDQDLDEDGHVECAWQAGTWSGDSDVTGSGDCAPLEASVYPGATELCDGQKNDWDAVSLSADETDDDTDG